MLLSTADVTGEFTFEVTDQQAMEGNRVQH